MLPLITFNFAFHIMFETSYIDKDYNLIISNLKRCSKMFMIIKDENKLYSLFRVKTMTQYIVNGSVCYYIKSIWLGVTIGDPPNVLLVNALVHGVPVIWLAHCMIVFFVFFNKSDSFFFTNILGLKLSALLYAVEDLHIFWLILIISILVNTKLAKKEDVPANYTSINLDFSYSGLVLHVTSLDN